MRFRHIVMTKLLTLVFGRRLCNVLLGVQHLGIPPFFLCRNIGLKFEPNLLKNPLACIFVEPPIKGEHFLFKG